MGTALTQQDTPGVKIAPPPRMKGVLQEAFFRVSFTSCFLLPSGRESGEDPRPHRLPLRHVCGSVAGEALESQQGQKLQLGFPGKTPRL